MVSASENLQFDTTLEPGDMVLGYSGSLTECRAANGRTVGTEGLLRWLRRLDASQPEALTGALLERVREEDPENLAEDDATLVLCRATRRGVAWRDNLLAPLRMLRPVLDRTNMK